jgi:hypothetical protein
MHAYTDTYTYTYTSLTPDRVSATKADENCFSNVTGILSYLGGKGGEKLKVIRVGGLWDGSASMRKFMALLKTRNPDPDPYCIMDLLSWTWV